jgi:hypothetical protein
MQPAAPTSSHCHQLPAPAPPRATVAPAASEFEHVYTEPWRQQGCCSGTACERSQAAGPLEAAELVTTHKQGPKRQTTKRTAFFCAGGCSEPRHWRASLPTVGSTSSSGAKRLKKPQTSSPRPAGNMSAGCWPSSFHRHLLAAIDRLRYPLVNGIHWVGAHEQNQGTREGMGAFLTAARLPRYRPYSHERSGKRFDNAALRGRRHVLVATSGSEIAKHLPRRACRFVSNHIRALKEEDHLSPSSISVFKSKSLAYEATFPS